MKRHVLFVLVIALAFVFVGCTEDDQEDNIPTSTSVLLDQTFRIMSELLKEPYRGTTLPRSLDDVELSYEVATAYKNDVYLEDNTVILTHKEYGPQDITLDITLSKDGYHKVYPASIRVLPQYEVDDFQNRQITYDNVSPYFDVESKTFTIYHIDEGIPYADVDAFLALVSDVTHSNQLVKTLDEDMLKYTWNQQYDITYEFKTTTLSFNHSDFFSAIGVYKSAFSMIEDCGALCRVSYLDGNTTTSSDASFDLGYYGMQFIRDDDTVYAPLALLNELFSGPYYDVTYTGHELIGYDSLALHDDAFLETVYPSTPQTMMQASYKAQTYHYLALVLDMFYGLDSFFEIDDFYDMLDPFESALLADDSESHYDGIVEIMLAFDERHTGTRYHGFYNEDQTIDRATYDLGPRVSDLKDNERWLKDNYCDNDSLVEISLDGTLARVRFNQFMEDEYLAFLEAIDTLDSYPDLEEVIIDLSCNSGGLLSILLSATGLFTDDPFAFSYINTLHQDQSTYNIVSPLEQLPYKLYIQTSDYSYSAAHIFTTYIDAYDLATVIGQPTGGGAAAIRDMVLPNGSHIVISSPLVFINQEDAIIEYAHTPDIVIPYEDFNDLETVKTYLE